MAELWEWLLAGERRAEFSTEVSGFRRLELIEHRDGGTYSASRQWEQFRSDLFFGDYIGVVVKTLAREIEVAIKNRRRVDG